MALKINGHNLVNKELEGANALNDYFKGILRDSNISVIDYAREIVSMKKLEREEEVFLIHTAERTKKAKDIVLYLGKRFGIRQDGNFDDIEGLTEMIYREPRIVSTIRPYGLGIGVTFSDEDVYGRDIDHHNSSDPMHVILSEIKRSIDIDRYVPIVNRLSFTIPSKRKSNDSSFDHKIQYCDDSNMIQVPKNAESDISELIDIQVLDGLRQIINNVLIHQNHNYSLEKKVKQDYSVVNI